jgi:hypothetical protein
MFSDNLTWLSKSHAVIGEMAIFAISTVKKLADTFP